MRILVWHVHGSWMNAFVGGRHTYLVPHTGDARGRGISGRDWPNAREVNADPPGELPLTRITARADRPGPPRDWSYGFLIDPMMYGSLASGRVFGHGGERIIMAFADPEFYLVAAFTFNGFLPWDVGDPRLTMTCAAIYEDVLGPGRAGPHRA